MEEIVSAKFVADTDEWASGVARVESGLDSIERKSTETLSSVASSVRETGSEVSTLGDAAATADDKMGFANAANAGAASLAFIASALNEVRAELGRAGAASDDLADRLAGPFKEANAEIAKLAEQQIVFGIDPEKAANALIAMNKYGVEPTQQNLTRLENVAASTGASFETMAQKFGQFNELPTERTLKGILKAIGATNDDLVPLGLHVDAANKALLDTPERVKDAQNALAAFVDANFSGSIDRVADDTTRLTGEFELFKREVGSGTNALKESFSPALRVVVGYLRSMPPDLKANVGILSEMVGATATAGAGALSLAANIALISQSATVATAATSAATGAFTALNAVAAAAVTPFGIALIAIGALAVGFQAYIVALEDAAKAEEALMAIEEKHARLLKENQNLIGKSADDVRKLGKTSKDLVGVIDGLRDQAERARAAGNTGLAAAKEAEVKDLERVKAELAAAEAGVKKATAAGPELSLKQQAAAEKRAQRDQDRQDKADKRKAEKAQRQAEAQAKRDESITEASHKAQLQSKQRQIDEENALLERQQKRSEGATDNTKAIRANLSRKLALEIEEIRSEERKALAQAKSEDARRAIVDASEDKIRAARAATANKSIEAQDREEELVKQATDKRKAEADRKSAEAKRDADKRKADGERLSKEADRLRKAEADQLARLASQGAAADEKVIDEKIKAAQKEAEDKGRDTTDQIKKLLSEKLAIQEREIRAERDRTIAAANSDEVRAAATATAEKKIRAAHAATTQQLADEIDKQKKLKADATKTEDTAPGAISLQQLADRNAAIFGDKAVLAKIAQNKAAGQTASPSSLSASNVVAAALSAPTATAKTAPPTADEIGKAVAKAVEQVLGITVSVTVPEGKDSKTFTGTASQLSKTKNVFNPKFTLGRSD